MKNQLIIFSKNRSCQLHLLLESLEKNSKDLFDSIFVIYTYTEKDYFDGYNKIIESFPKVSFVVEDDFFKDTMKLVSDNSFEYTTFMVDDNVFYRGLPISREKIFNLFNDQNKPISCFSLRLGLNCNYSHPANLSYTIGNYETVDENGGRMGEEQMEDPDNMMGEAEDTAVEGPGQTFEEFMDSFNREPVRTETGDIDFSAEGENTQMSFEDARSQRMRTQGNQEASERDQMGTEDRNMAEEPQEAEVETPWDGEETKEA